MVQRVSLNILANSCFILSREFVSCLQLDYLRKCCSYENLKTRLFVDIVLYKICPYRSKCQQKVTWMHQMQLTRLKRNRNAFGYLFIYLIETQLKPV